jgi:hypothetical protein
VGKGENEIGEDAKFPAAAAEMATVANGVEPREERGGEPATVCLPEHDS